MYMYMYICIYIYIYILAPLAIVRSLSCFAYFNVEVY